ncbi:type IV pilus twitching motility protein PilT [Kiritimatiella glycovorans]|nr:type IV pilus twitching motility protein PilT [Kiritimatiella glycovorans]
MDQLLSLVLEKGGSDLHVSAGYRPSLRIDGQIEFLKKSQPLTGEQTQRMIYRLMSERTRREFEEHADTDFAYALEDLGRFRVNVFRDLNGVGAVARLIPNRVPTLDELEMPRVIREFCMLSKGLVIITGPTGSGKSTTLAAMIEHINRTRREHVVTIEDPIEFIHRARGCLINQREVHEHTTSFAKALRAALREDPDIVLVGEMRDLETMETAIETAETGHLVLGTLHTNTAAGTVDRIIDKFPADRQNQIRVMLADTLKGVMAQTLCRCEGGGRTAATEVLVVTSAVSANIREGKTHQIPSAMQTGKNVGMHQFEDTLLQLVLDGRISPTEAYLKSIQKLAIRQKLEQHGIEIPPPDDTPFAEEADSDDEAERAAEALEENPDQPDALCRLAWVRATSTEESRRDGREALELASRALSLSGGHTPLCLTVMSAACAELGRFDDAGEYIQSAIKNAREKGQENIAADLEQYARCIENREPIRD